MCGGGGGWKSLLPIGGALLGNSLLSGPIGSGLGLGANSALASGLGAAAGAGAGGLLAGYNPRDALLGAGIAGLGAGGVSALKGNSFMGTPGGADVGGAVAGMGAATPAGPSAGTAPAALGGAGGPNIDLTGWDQMSALAPDVGGTAGLIPVGTAPAGLDPLAAMNFAAENTANPAQSALQAMGVGGGTAVPSAGPTGGGAAAAGAGRGAVPGGAVPFDYGSSTLGKVMTQLGLPQSSITEAIAKNPGALLAGGGLAMNMMRDQSIPGAKELQGQADAAAARGAQMQQYLATGTLPPGAQASVDQATAAAKAAIRSKYATMGMSGSTAEVQDLNNIDMQAKAQAGQIAAQLLDTGVRESGLASQIYTNLLRLNQQQTDSTGRAIANFAAALG
jgi:hypothetical protein